jgi:hypothetical protein
MFFSILFIYLLYFKKIMYKNYIKKKRFFYFPDLFQEINVQKLFQFFFFLDLMGA